MISLVKDEEDSSLVADDQDTMETAILKFVQQSTALQNYISDKY